MPSELHKNNVFVDTIGHDVFDGGDGDDTAIYLFKSSPLRITLSGPDDSTVYVGGVAEDSLRNIEDIVGGVDNDILTGDAKGNILFGMSGDDHLRGEEGPDQLEGGSGRDTIDGGNGVDWVSYKDKGLPVHAALSGANDSTVYIRSIAEDTIRNIESIQGGANKDVLTGDNKDNGLMGMADDDSLYGEGGADKLQGNGGKDFLDGGSGMDWALYKDKQARVSVELSEYGDSTVYVAGVAEDTLRNIESLQGGTRNDYLMGNSQNNILEGREGPDMLLGKGGSDQFLYTDASHGDDIIWDFTRSEGDKISLDLLSHIQGEQELSFTGRRSEPFSVWYTITRDGGGNHYTRIKADTDGDEETTEFTIALIGRFSLTADDFILV